MKAAEDGRRYDAAHVLDGAMDRSVLVERPMGPQFIIIGGILRQVFNPRQQLLVHHPRDEGQNACPIHSSSTPADLQLLAQKIVASGTQRGYTGNGQLTVFSTVLIF
jgi:hypothetical protein